MSCMFNFNLMHVFCLKLHVSYDTFIVNMQVLCFLQVLSVLEIMKLIIASPGCIVNVCLRSMVY